MRWCCVWNSNDVFGAVVFQKRGHSGALQRGLWGARVTAVVAHKGPSSQTPVFWEESPRAGSTEFELHLGLGPDQLQQSSRQSRV